jgi:LPXTG-motif cell wall-anchored protein
VNKKLRTIILLALAFTLMLGIAGMALAEGWLEIQVGEDPPEGGEADWKYDEMEDIVELSATANPGWRFTHWTYYQQQVYNINIAAVSSDSLIDVNDPNASFEPPHDEYVNIIFTAHFERVRDETYTVSYHPNGGTGTVPIDMNRYYPGEQAMLKSGAGLTMPGKVFAGWSLTGSEPIQMIPYTMGRSDVTFFAVWAPLTVPKTGDAPNSLGVLLMVSGAALLAAAVLRRRAEN